MAKTPPAQDTPDGTRAVRLHIQGDVGVHLRLPKPLTLNSLDLTLLRRLLLEAERVLLTSQRKHAVPTTLQGFSPALDGGIVLRFAVAEAVAESLAEDLNLLLAGGGLDKVRATRARQIQQWQQRAEINAAWKFQVQVELAPQGPQQRWVGLRIDSNTDYSFRELFTDAELYLYGTITKMGGKGVPRLQIKDERLGMRSLKAKRQMLETEQNNRLYRTGGIHARARLNTAGGKIDRLELIRFIDLKPLPAPERVEDLLHVPNFPTVSPDWVAQHRQRA